MVVDVFESRILGYMPLIVDTYAGIPRRLHLVFPQGT